jgi:uncharacterized protein YjdB
MGERKWSEPMRVVRILLSALLAVATVSCCDSPTSPSSQISGPPLSVVVTGPDTLQIGQKVPLKAIATYSDGTQQDVTGIATWSSNNPGVCTVDAKGIVTGVAQGVCVITATVHDVSGTHTITVGQPNNPNTPDGPVNPDNPAVGLVVQGATSVKVGASTPWHAVAVFKDGSQQDVTSASVWTSDQPGVASVANGLVTGVSQGTTPIHATYQGLQATGAIQVTAGDQPTPTVTSLTVSGNTNISVGQNSQLTATAHFSDGSSQNVTSAAAWSSATPSVATVLGGLVHGVAQGAAPITASYGGQNATVTVNVSGSTGPVVNSLSVTGTSPMTVGQQAQYTAIANMSDGSSPNVTSQSQWTSTNPSVATVDSNGVVTAIAQGTTTITATYQGQTGFVPLTVNNGTPPPPTEPDLIGLEVDLGVNVLNIQSAGGMRTQATGPLDVNLGTLADLLANNHLLDLRVWGLYSDNSKKDVTDLSTINCDSVQTPTIAPCILGVDGFQTGQILALLIQGLLNPNHKINVTYGGFTADVNVHVDLPLLTGLGFPTDLGQISLTNGNQLPPLTGLFSQGIQSTLDASLPTCTGSVTTDCVDYALTATGPLAGTLNTVLGLLGVNIDQLLSVTDGVVSVNQGLLTQILNNPLIQLLNLGGVLPLDLTATVNGIVSNPLSVVLGQPQP